MYQVPTVIGLVNFLFPLSHPRARFRCLSVYSSRRDWLAQDCHFVPKEEALKRRGLETEARVVERNWHVTNHSRLLTLISLTDFWSFSNCSLSLPWCSLSSSKLRTLFSRSLFSVLNFFTTALRLSVPIVNSEFFLCSSANCRCSRPASSDADSIADRLFIALICTWKRWTSEERGSLESTSQWSWPE